MVCKRCLGSYYGGAEKTCSHGWDLLKGKPLERECSECGEWSNDLHCPDGGRIQTDVLPDQPLMIVPRTGGGGRGA